MNVKSVSFYAAVIFMICLMFAVSYAVNRNPKSGSGLSGGKGVADVIPSTPLPALRDRPEIQFAGVRMGKQWVVPEIALFGGVSGNWLTIKRTDKNATEQRQYDPCYTYLVSNFQPIVQLMDDGRYEITFTSPVTRDLP